MLKLNDYSCPNCQYTEEILTENELNPPCPECQTPMQRIFTSPPILMSDRENREKMLRRRSQEHTRRCKEKGIPLDANDTNISSDPVWRNKYRAKNTRTDTISQHANDHIHWQKQNEILKKQHGE